MKPCRLQSTRQFFLNSWRQLMAESGLKKIVLTLLGALGVVSCTNGKLDYFNYRDGLYTCQMGFFVSTTQVSDSIGVANADAQCQALSTKVGDCSKRPWKAYLSSAAGNARDRIGNGPWYNIKGQLFAANLQSLFAPPPSSTLFRTELDQDASTVTAMTGSDTQGLRNHTCDTDGQISFGFPNSQWSYVSESSCSSTYRLYCFASD